MVVKMRKDKDADEGKDADLDLDAEHEDEDGDEHEDDEDSGDDDSDEGEKKQYVTQDDLNKAMEKVGDRLVNTVLKEMRGGRLQKQPPAAPKAGAKAEPEPVVPEADVRGARSAFREYVAEEITFLGNDERKFAIDLGTSMIRAQALTGFDDEDEVGLDVARKVAGQVRALRKFYEERTKSALRRKGLLQDQKGGQQPAGSAGGGRVAGDSQFQAGASLAAQRHPRS